MKILIIGGGIAGMCAAIELRKRKHQVDLVELDPNWRVYGAGITLSGPTPKRSRSVKRHAGPLWKNDSQWAAIAARPVTGACRASR